MHLTGLVFTSHSHARPFCEPLLPQSPFPVLSSPMLISCRLSFLSSLDLKSSPSPNATAFSSDLHVAMNPFLRLFLLPTVYVVLHNPDSSRALPACWLSDNEWQDQGWRCSMMYCDTLLVSLMTRPVLGTVLKTGFPDGILKWGLLFCPSSSQRDREKVLITSELLSLFGSSPDYPLLSLADPLSR